MQDVIVSMQEQGDLTVRDQQGQKEVGDRNLDNNERQQQDVTERNLDTTEQGQRENIGKHHYAAEQGQGDAKNANIDCKVCCFHPNVQTFHTHTKCIWSEYSIASTTILVSDLSYLGNAFICLLGISSHDVMGHWINPLW